MNLAFHSKDIKWILAEWKMFGWNHRHAQPSFLSIEMCLKHSKLNLIKNKLFFLFSFVWLPPLYHYHLQNHYFQLLIVCSVAKMLLWFLKINYPFRCIRFTWIKIARVSRALPPFVYFSVLFFCGTHICPHVCSVLRQHYLRQTIDWQLIWMFPLEFNGPLSCCLD